MEGIITLLVLYFLFSMIFKKIKNLSTGAKQTQEQPETAVHLPVKPPVAKPKSDFRFPSMSTAAAPLQEGRMSNAVMHEYQPITTSPDLKSQFTEYQGSLNANTYEGIGYQSEKYEPEPTAYTSASASENGIHILPEDFTRDTLIQAVVMSEILKRPGVRR